MLLGDIAADQEVGAYTDEELLAAARKSEHLFALLVRRYEEAFIRRARHIIGSQRDAEDIVQDTFLKIYVHADKFQPQEGATFRSWGYRILTNTAFTHYQKLKKKRSLQMDLDPEIYESFMDGHDEVRAREWTDLAWDLLNKLPYSLSRPLQLFFLEEYSQKEIAEMEGTTIAAVKTRIYRAKHALEDIARAQNDIA